MPHREDHWTVVYPGDNFPKGAVRALGRGLDCSGNDGIDSFVALWVRDDGESVFGCAWPDSNGKVKAVFPYDRRAVHENDTKGFRILTYAGPGSKNGFKYRWVRANRADERKLLYVGEYTPCVVTCTKKHTESLGKASWGKKMAWTCSGENEAYHKDDEFNEAFLLCKEPVDEAHGGREEHYDPHEHH